MHVSKAFRNVRSAITEALQREHQSPTMLYIFRDEIEKAIVRLKGQFNEATCDEGQHLIHPKMILKYAPDGKEDVPLPVWCPIKNSQGKILEMKVVSRFHKRYEDISTKVYLTWETPNL